MATIRADGEVAASVAMVFVLGTLLGGVADHLLGNRVWGMRLPPKHHSVEWTQELQLTVDHQKQLNGIMAAAQAKWRALYAPLEPQRTEIREESHNQIRKILTPEQVPKFDAFTRQLDEQRKRDAQKSAIPGPTH